jgi:hypothetical protein
MIVSTIIPLILTMIITGSTFVGCDNNANKPSEEGNDMNNSQHINDSSETGIEFREVDLSKPNEQGSTWENIGHTVESSIDFEQFAGQSIATVDEAVSVANMILEHEQSDDMFGEFELMMIEYDSDKNIWIFIYWENDTNVLGSSFHVAVDGNTAKILRLWVL